MNLLLFCLHTVGLDKVIILIRQCFCVAKRPQGLILQY